LFFGILILVLVHRLTLDKKNHKNQINHKNPSSDNRKKQTLKNDEIDANHRKLISNQQLNHSSQNERLHSGKCKSAKNSAFIFLLLASKKS